MSTAITIFVSGETILQLRFRVQDDTERTIKIYAQGLVAYNDEQGQGMIDSQGLVA